MTDKKKTNFSAVLSPNNSLGPRGFAVLMVFVSIVSFTLGIFFATLGAWPIFGFFGLDVLFLYWAFKHNFKHATRREFVDITDREVIVSYRNLNQPEKVFRFNKHWVQLDLNEDKARELIGALKLTAHGKTLEIGSFLGPDERKDFYFAFRKALAN